MIMVVIQFIHLLKCLTEAEDWNKTKQNVSRLFHTIFGYTWDHM
jgi:hypothetical protein